MTTTTARLDAQIEKHMEGIEAFSARFGLPLHVFFVEEMEANIEAFRTVAAAHYPRTTIAFAVKSNPCRGAVRAAACLGLGADVASEYELQLALEEHMGPATILCNGNAKSDDYLERAASAGCPIAVDNSDELDALDALLHGTGRKAQVLLRFRGMPLAGLTSDDQTTAADWTKFGFHIDEAPALFARLAEAAALHFVGISAHIGTQIAEPGGYERLLDHLLDLAQDAQSDGLNVEMIDIGGGFPVSFLSEDEWAAFQARLLARLRGDLGTSGAVTWNDIPMGYARTAGDENPAWIGKAYWSRVPIARMHQHLLGAITRDGRSVVERLHALGDPTLVIEPGRSLMANAGITLTEVMGVKRVLEHTVVSLDMGINNHGTNLISPDIFPAAVLPRRESDTPEEAFLAGRLCFSGDMISKAKVDLNRLPKRGERFILYHTGAYSADHFASNSCGFPRPAKVAIRPDGSAELWRAPETYKSVHGAPAEDLTILDV